MAAIASAPVNLTPEVLNELTSKVEKETEIKTVELSDSESIHEQTVVVEGISQIALVREHVEVRSSLHKDAVHLRNDLQLHVRCIQRSGDELLTKIRDAVEELDTAVHAQRLAEQELHEMESRHDYVKKQLDLVTKECSVLHARIREMSRARDKAEIEVEKERGRLMEKKQQWRELKQENSRLHVQIAELSEQLLDFTSRLAEKESQVQKYRTDVQTLTEEKESYRLKNEESETQRKVLKIQSATFEAQSKHFEAAAAKFEGELKGVQAELVTITAKLKSAIREAKNSAAHAAQAISDKKKAEEAERAATLEAAEAIAIRDDAIAARNQVIEREKSIIDERDEERIQHKETREYLKISQESVTIYKRENDRLEEEVRKVEHLRDEEAHNFRETDKKCHELEAILVTIEAKMKHGEEKVERFKRETHEAKRSRDILFIAKQQVEEVLRKTEVAKNNAIAAELKISQEYIEADRERDEAIKKYEDMEDQFQDTDKALAIAKEKLENSQIAEKAASFKLVQVTEKFEATQKSETTLKQEKVKLSEEAKSAKATANHAKKELTTQAEKHTKETAKLQKDLATVQANEQVLIKGNRQLVEDKASLSKQLVAKNPDSPVPEVAGIVIRHIFFGSVRITSPTVYQKVLDSYTQKDAHGFTVDKYFVEGADPDHQSTLIHHRYLVVYYAVRKGNALVDKLPIWYKEGSSHNKFHPH